MRWQDTDASQCRYGDITEKIFGEHEILWEHSTDDYQGEVTILTKHGDTYRYYQYYYGSCGGCDEWESDNLTDRQIEEEMRKNIRAFQNKDELKEYLDNNHSHILAALKEIL